MISEYAVRMKWHLQLQSHTHCMFAIRVRHTSIDLQNARQMLALHQQSAAAEQTIREYT